MQAAPRCRTVRVTDGVNFVRCLSPRPRPLAVLRRAKAASGVTDYESDNPQNVPPPLVMPHPSFSVEEAVLVQVEAARDNNTPRESHGVHVLYAFCRDAGSMERSKYFGFSKDLYHLDHFLNIAAVYPQLFRSDGCAVVGKPSPHEDGSVRVPVVLHSAAGEESTLGACSS